MGLYLRMQAPYGPQGEFLSKTTLKFHAKKCQISCTLSVLKWDALLHGETSIADGVFHNIP